MKTGALGSAANVRVVASIAAAHPRIPLVVDPVMLPTRGGARLLVARACGPLREHLIPRATLVTANALEASALTGLEVRTALQARAAALKIVAMGARAALVKGGHLLPGADAVDTLALRSGRVVELRGARLDLPPLHGGGCVLASLIAACLATTGAVRREADIEAAVREGRRLHRRALRRPVDVGGAMRVIVP
jgi:hydroxymethylpyrimidine/phosphomethylpyrimidine kinase